MCRKDRGTLVVLGVTVHGVTIPVKRIETRIGVPGFVEMDAIHARIQQLLHTLRVVAEAVVGGIGDDRVDGACVDSFGYQRIGFDGSLQGFLAETIRRNRADGTVSIGPWYQVVGDWGCDKPAMLG